MRHLNPSNHRESVTPLLAFDAGHLEA